MDRLGSVFLAATVPNLVEFLTSLSFSPLICEVIIRIELDKIKVILRMNTMKL